MSLCQYKMELGRHARLHDDHAKWQQWLTSSLLAPLREEWQSGSLEVVDTLAWPPPTDLQTLDTVE
eukprot:11000927-Prorocentrum_lima.AAC.1